MRSNICVCVCCVQGTSVEMQSVTHRNLSGRNVTAPTPVLSPSSILPPRPSQCAFISARKNSQRVSEVFFINLKNFVKY